VCVLRPFF